MCDWRPGPRCANDAARDLAKARSAFEAEHPFEPLPDVLMDYKRRMQALDADYAVARANARTLSRAVRAARADGADETTVADLETHLDREVCQALAVRENLSGVCEEREVTRREHLDRHAAAVLADQPADAAPDAVAEAGPERTDAWDPKTGRHKITGTRFDEAGFDRDGYHRRTQRDALGYHRQTGTMLSPSGHLPDGSHYTDHGVAPERAFLRTATDVVNDAPAEPTKRTRAPKTSEEVAPAVPAPAAPALPPLRTKKAAHEAFRTKGSRWTIATDASPEPAPVTVVDSSTTSVWVRPDDADPADRPIWLPVKGTAGWEVHEDGDGFTDTYGTARLRRLAA